MKIQDTFHPYSNIERDPIQYTVCRDFDHISRYKGLRQVVHQGLSYDRYVALETANSFQSRCEVTYYIVPSSRRNRLDLIARDHLGSATYAWIIAYFNGIEDGYSVPEGTKLAIPTSLSDLFNTGEVLSPINALALNLGSE